MPPKDCCHLNAGDALGARTLTMKMQLAGVVGAAGAGAVTGGGPHWKLETGRGSAGDDGCMIAAIRSSNGESNGPGTLAGGRGNDDVTGAKNRRWVGVNTRSACGESEQQEKAG